MNILIGMKALILDKDGTLFPYSIWINPIKRCLIENLPLKRFCDERKSKIVTSFLKVLSIEGGTINSDSPLYERRRRPVAVIKLMMLTLYYRLNPFKAMRGFLKIKHRSSYGLEEEIKKYNLDEVKSTLRKLREKKIIIALFTNDSPSSVRAIEKELDFTFDYTVDSSSRIKKPNKLAVLLFATFSGIESRDIALLSDTPEDLRMAQKAKCGAVVALEGTLEKMELEKYSDKVISSFGEIASLFGSNSPVAISTSD